MAQGNTITWTNGQSTSLLNRAFPLKPQAHAKRKNCAALSDRWAVADKVVGQLTSVAWSPDLGTAIALCYLHRSVEPPCAVHVQVDGAMGGTAAARALALPLL